MEVKSPSTASEIRQLLLYFATKYKLDDISVSKIRWKLGLSLDTEERTDVILAPISGAQIENYCREASMENVRALIRIME